MYRPSLQRSFPTIVLSSLVTTCGLFGQGAPGNPCDPTITGIRIGQFLYNPEAHTAGHDTADQGTLTPQGVFHVALGRPVTLLEGALGDSAVGYLGSLGYSSNILQPLAGPLVPPGSHILGDFVTEPGGGGGGGGFFPLPYFGTSLVPTGKSGSGFYQLPYSGVTVVPDTEVHLGANHPITGIPMQYQFTIPNEAKVFGHAGSGDRFYEFIDSQENPTGVAEIRHVDGTVVVLASYPSPNPTLRTYRTKHILDPFDNRVTFEYGPGASGPGSGLLDRIHYPNGITEVWNFDPAWAQNVPFTGIELTYLNAPPGIDLTWGMVFAPTAEGEFPFAGGRLFRIYYPKSEYLQTPAAGSLYTLNATDAYVVYEFQANGTDPYLLVTDIYQARAAAIIPDAVLPNPLKTLHVDYGLSGTQNPQYRVTGQTLAQHGETTSFSYGFHTGQATDLVQYIYETSSIATITTTELDLEGRPVSITIAPDASTAVGMPRFYESDPPQVGPTGEPFSSVPWSGEPTSLTWTFEYGGCSVCRKPIKIRDPSLRETLFSYFPDTGLIDTITTLNPANPATTVEHKFTWEKEREKGRSPLASVTMYHHFACHDTSLSRCLAQSGGFR